MILHEYQEDPLRKEIMHTDFLVVDLTQEIEANVRVELMGDAVGVRNGGLLQHILHDISITAKPDEIPEVIQVDTSNLEIGESITIGEVKGITRLYSIMKMTSRLLRLHHQEKMQMWTLKKQKRNKKQLKNNRYMSAA
ncbi:50S ribosomal protein L25 [Bacillus sp. N9]